MSTGVVCVHVWGEESYGRQSPSLSIFYVCLSTHSTAQPSHALGRPPLSSIASFS